MPRPKPPITPEIGDLQFPLPFAGRLGVSINETCQALGVKRDKIYELIHKGEPDGLTASQIGRRTIVHVASIHRLLQRTIVQPKSPRVRRIRNGAAVP